MQIAKVHDLDKFIRMSLLVIIAVWSFKLIFPFVGVLSWGVILAVSLYPMFNWMSDRFGGRSTFAATVVMTISLFLFIGAIIILSKNAIHSLSVIVNKIRAGEVIIPSPPISIKDWPLVGNKLYDFWFLIYSNLNEAMNQYSSYLINFSGLLINKLADKGLDILAFILAILFSGYLMVNGSRFVYGARKFADRVSPNHGDKLIKIMKDTVQNVSRGVIGISLLQSFLFGLVLLYVGIPIAGLLAFAAFFICLLQVGLIFLIIPVAIWLFATNDILQALIPFIMLILVALLDTLMKPFVFAKGLQTPTMIIFIGVIAGIASYGFLGIFIGPVILALFYDLVCHWLDSNRH